jgi:uncharacterized protein (DUF1778 family)
MTGHHPFSKLRDAMSSERQAANKEATEKAIADSQVTRLTGQDAGRLLKMLETPPEPTEALVEAFKRHRRIVESR